MPLAETERPVDLYNRAKSAMAEAAIIMAESFTHSVESGNYCPPNDYLGELKGISADWYLGEHTSNLSGNLTEVLMWSWLSTGTQRKQINFDHGKREKIGTMLDAIEDHTSFLESNFPQDLRVQHVLGLLRAAGDDLGTELLHSK